MDIPNYTLPLPPSLPLSLLPYLSLSLRRTAERKLKEKK
jgi:hypothetical protein